MYVDLCQTTTFESLDIGSSYLYIGIRIKFVYEGHRVNVNVTGAKKVANACSCIGQLSSAIFIGTRQITRRWLSSLRLEGILVFFIAVIMSVLIAELRVEQ